MQTGMTNDLQKPFFEPDILNGPFIDFQQKSK